MRLLHVSDLHFHLPWYEWVAQRARDFDVTCVSGDWLSRSSPVPAPLRRQVRWVRDWLRAFPGTLAGCTGNHDWWSSEPPVIDVHADGKWLTAARREGVVLDESRLVCGYDFHAHPWGDGLALYPSDPVILLAHEPPHGHPVSFFDGKDLGDVDVMDTAARLPAGSYVLSGHVHHPRRWCCRIGDAWAFNPGVGDRDCPPNHIEIDTVRQVAKPFLNGKALPPRSLALA